MQRKIYRLEPAALPDDPNWDRAPSQGTVIVRADSPADARIVASLAEADFPETGAKPGDGVSTRFASAFRDDKLYTVIEDLSGEYPDEGERMVLEGAVRKDVVKPLQNG
jgi:hypothetical protein